MTQRCSCLSMFDVGCTWLRSCERCADEIFPCDWSPTNESVSWCHENTRSSADDLLRHESWAGIDAGLVSTRLGYVLSGSRVCCCYVSVSDLQSGNFFPEESAQQRIDKQSSLCQCSKFLRRGLPQERANNGSTNKLSICQRSRIWKRSPAGRAQQRIDTNCRCDSASGFGRVSIRNVRSNESTNRLSMCQSSRFWKASPAETCAAQIDKCNGAYQ